MQNKRILIENIDIVTVNENNTVIKNGIIYVEGDTIRYVSTQEDMPYYLEVDELIDGKGKIAMPGLVNAHCHSPMTLLRGYAGDRNLEDWLFHYILPMEQKLTPEDVYWGSMLGIVEMLKSGTTCFMDMYFHMDQVAQAVLDSGIRANIAFGPITHPSVGEEVVNVSAAKEFLSTWNGAGDGRISNFIEIHSVYLYKEESIRQAAAFAKEQGVGIHMHLLETAFEKENTVAQYGVDSVRLAERCGMFDVPNLAAHCVHLDDAQLEILKNYGVSVAHNPTSNLKLASGVARIPEMLDLGINVAIGTDGTASNNNLNMFEEMHLAALLHKGVSMDATVVSAPTAIRMATANGAKALGLEGQVGQIKPGFKADLILVDMNKPHLVPVHDAEAALVYSAQGSDVDTVMVNGKVLVQGGRLVTIDEGLVMEKVKEISARVMG